MMVLLLLGLLAVAGNATATELEDITAKANNPLTPLESFSLQNSFTAAQNRETNATANTLNIRLLLPFLPHIFRLTVPLVTVPVANQDSKSGLGDIVLFDAILLTHESSKFQFHLGPLLVFPSATQSALGQGKWQVGAVSVVLSRLTPEIQLGSLVTIQTSVAGDSQRQSVTQLEAQPLLFLQLGHGYYLRSTANMTFNFSSGQFVVPLGVGAGKVLETSLAILNLYLEPQFTVLHFGQTQPAFQLFGGITVQFH